MNRPAEWKKRRASSLDKEELDSKAARETKTTHMRGSMYNQHMSNHSPRAITPSALANEVHQRQVKCKILKKRDVITLDNDAQTESAAYLDFACKMFMLEIQAAIQDEQTYQNEVKFHELLKKAQHIIDRIKSKA